MKEEFECAIDRCGLPLKLDEATKGDGNCWVRAVQQQLERPELGQQRVIEYRGMHTGTP